MTDYTLLYLLLLLIASFGLIVLDIMKEDRELAERKHAWKLRDKSFFVTSQK